MVPIQLAVTFLSLSKVFGFNHRVVLNRLGRVQSMSALTFSLVLDPFGLRQFNNPNYTGTQVFYDESEFEAKVNEFYQSGTPLVDGYAPFCKHLFIPNFAGIRCGYAIITPQNSALVKSCYESRKPGELPVLIQYFDRSEVDASVATHLDIILYSREQIIKENIAMGESPPDTDAPWGIIRLNCPARFHTFR